MPMTGADEVVKQFNNQHFRVIPAETFPHGRTVLPLHNEETGVITWCLRAGASVEDIADELNLYREHLLRHGLAEFPRGGTRPPRVLRAS